MTSDAVSAAPSQPQWPSTRSVCQLTTQRAEAIPFLIFPLSHLYAQETPSALSEERLWLPQGDGEPRRWCPLPPTDKGKELKPLAAGRWWGHQPRVGGRGIVALPGADVLPWPAPRACHCVRRAVPKHSSKKCEEAKEGKWWCTHATAETKPTRCQDAVGEEVASCCGHQESNYRACLAQSGQTSRSYRRRRQHPVSMISRVLGCRQRPICVLLDIHTANLSLTF